MSSDGDDRAQDLQARARDLASFIAGYEDECDAEGLSERSRSAIEDRVRESGLAAMNMPEAWGGAGLTVLEQVIVMEQLGTLSNWLWWMVWKPANVLRYCSEPQAQRYLLPAIRGEVRECFAVTEPGAGSDAGSVTTTAKVLDEGYELTGEKWFATAADVADFLIVLAVVEPGHQLTLFLVDKGSDGLEIVHTPRMITNAPHEHPQVRFEGVRVAGDAVLGEVGTGFDLTKEWFVEERLFIAARCVGGAERALTLAAEWANQRIQFGRPIAEFQHVQRHLSDAAVDIALNRALLRQTAAQADVPGDRKLLHAKAAMTKLAASEAAGRVLDGCLQVFGGRGLDRGNPIERLARGLRAERIWEGTSEIQRNIIANHIRKRGPGDLLEGQASAGSGDADVTGGESG